MTHLLVVAAVMVVVMVVAVTSVVSHLNDRQRQDPPTDTEQQQPIQPRCAATLFPVPHGMHLLPTPDPDWDYHTCPHLSFPHHC